jgi:hypothetical protein
MRRLLSLGSLTMPASVGDIGFCISVIIDADTFEQW